MGLRSLIRSLPDIRRVVCALALCASGATAQEAWVSQSVLPHLYSVHFVDANTGWIAGAGGIIRKTSDGGATWRTQTSGTTAPLYSIRFANADTGYAVGANGTILRTVDGGAAWTPQVSDSVALLRSIYCLDARTVWAAGSDGKIFRTTNAGERWTRSASGTTGSFLAIHFADAATAWAAGPSFVRKTVDGGANWVNQSATLDILSLYFHDTNTGWVVGGRTTPGAYTAFVRKTVDGGAFWGQQVLENTGPLYGVHFVDANTGYVVGYGGAIRKTTDGGTTWAAQVSDTYMQLNAVYFTDARVGYVVGNNGTVLKTTDGGATWVQQTSGTTASLYSVHFVDERTGWAVGAAGTILKTENGGVDFGWNRQTSGTKAILRSVRFLDANTGWAVGDSGTILKTVNGGRTWNRQNSGVSNWLYCVRFVDANTGWAVGTHGAIIKTTNGGTSWSRQATDNSTNFSTVHFLDANTGWAGGGSLIAKTSDGGARWQWAQIPGAVAFNALHFVDANIGWSVGFSGQFRKTINGGSPDPSGWSLDTLNASLHLLAVQFLDASTGWITGENGRVWKSVDGGSTWTSQATGTTTHLMGLHMVNANAGWAVGHGGVILRINFNGLLAAPTLAAPAETAVDVNPSPAPLQWQAVAGAQTYQVQVAEDPGFAAPMAHDSWTHLTSLSVGPLKFGVTYSWRVRARNASGNGPWSSPRSFTTRSASPGAVALSSPVNRATAVPVAPVLTWRPSSQATSYQVQVSMAANFSPLVKDTSGVTDTALSLQSLPWGTPFYWRARASLASGAGPWSDTWVFTTVAAIAEPPRPSFPADAATGVPADALLRWRRIAEAESYRLQLSASPDFSAPIRDVPDIVDTTFTTGGLSLGTTYYWRLRAKNSLGSSDWSSAFGFTTVLPAPIPVLPPDSIPTLPVHGAVLAWFRVPEASTYRLQVAEDSLFESRVLDTSGLTDTSCALRSLSNEARYYWRVLSRSAHIASEWSAGRRFVTPMTWPSAPVLVRPSPGEILASDSVILVWHTAYPHVSHYRLEISPDSLFTGQVLSFSNLKDTSQVVSRLANNTRYWWRVQAFNGVGEGQAAVFHFVVKIPSTGLPPRELVLEWLGGDGSRVLRYSLPRGEQVRIRRLDPAGREVLLFEGRQEAGHHVLRIRPETSARGNYILDFRAGTHVRRFVMRR